MKKLEMVFKNELGKTTKISVDHAKDDLTKEQVDTAMKEIIAKNIFETQNGELKEIDGARVVSTDIVELI